MALQGPPATGAPASLWPFTSEPGPCFIHHPHLPNMHGLLSREEAQSTRAPGGPDVSTARPLWLITSSPESTAGHTVVTPKCSLLWSWTIKKPYISAEPMPLQAGSVDAVFSVFFMSSLQSLKTKLSRYSLCLILDWAEHQHGGAKCQGSVVYLSADVSVSLSSATFNPQDTRTRAERWRENSLLLPPLLPLIILMLLL